MAKTMTSNLQDGRRLLVAWAVDPIGKILSRTAISPNLVTIVAFIIAIISSVLISQGITVPGGIVLLLSGFLDLIDGALARAKSQVTKFGAVLDSTLDRFSEALVFLAIIYFALSGKAQNLLIILSVAGLAASFMISYIKARAEGMGIECNVGIFTRAERIVLLSLGLLLNQLLIAISLLVALSVITIVQRLHRVWKFAGK